MLETIREYARERLAAAPDHEADRVYEQFVQYYLRMAEEAEPHLRTAQRPAWLARLEAEHDNLRTALEWTRTSQDVASELRLVEALTWFWYLSGYLSEGRAQLERALAQTTSADRTAGARRDLVWRRRLRRNASRLRRGARSAHGERRYLS